jgi:hypothetical protein
MTGVFYDDDGSWQREDWQSYFDGLGVQYEVRNQSSLGYTNNTFPYNDESNSWTITYYDDYDFDNDGVADVQKINEAEFDTTDHDDTFYPNYKVSGFAQFNRLQDKVTKTKVKVFTATEGIYDQSNKQYNNCPYFPANLYYKGDKITLSPGFQTHTSQNVHIGANITLPSTSTKWLETVMFYDKYGRVIQTQSSNHLDGMDIVSTQYEFAGKVLQTKRTHYVAFQ